MGLIKAAVGSLGGVLADQWKEYFYCEAMPMNVLMTKGVKKTSARSTNTKGSENIITNGSIIAVADGQCMIIVEQGKIVEVCAEPGEFTYNSSTEPSVFAGSFGDGLKQSFATLGKRFTFGGESPKDQRIYYFNTKELMDNKFGTATPIPFKAVDTNIGFSVSVSLRCSGTYTYRITDPIVFYTNVCGNVSDEFTRDTIDNQLKTEFISALQPAFGKLSLMKLLPEDVMNHTPEMEEALKEALSAKWTKNRGITVGTVALNNISLPEADQERIKDAQMYTNPGMAAGMMAKATADSMKTAAGNTAGAMTGFMGMGMAMNGNGGMMNNITNLYGMAQQNQQMQQQQMNNAPQQAGSAQGGWVCSCGANATGNFCPQCGNKKPEPVKADGWVCSNCGKTVTGKFCPECGTPKPAEDGWTCSCGAVNKGKFCMECGKPKPAGAPLYRCDKCGWEPADPKNPPKFCPECGDIFDDNDKQ